MKMHLAHTVNDLNLLTTLRHLLATGSVTATAERMRLSQPAVSRALGRLRSALNDPLFVRANKRLVPTPRAAALQPELEALMARLDDLLTSGAGFVPATSTRTFVVATSDYTASVLMGPLLERLRREAPGVTVRVVQTVPDAEGALTDGAWDLLWAPMRELSQAVVWTRLFEEDFVFVVRRGHPVASRPLTLERYLSVPQLALSPEGKPGNPLDAQLERLGVRRRVVAHVPTFATVPSLIAASDFGAVLPRRIVAQHGRAWRLVERTLPFALRGFTLYQAWHERHRHDEGHAWFRQLVAELGRSNV